MTLDQQEKVVSGEVSVPGSLERVWKAWTTDRGAEGFFAPECHIDLRPGGRYEIFFNPLAETGRRGSDKMIVLAVQPMKMLSFTWNSPPELPEVCGQMTHMLVRFFALDADHTRVTLVQDGWGEGGQWDQSYDYFTIAWLQVVLPRLNYCFTAGPIDWEKPPSMTELGKGAMVAKPADFDVATAHRFFSADCFNRAWELIDKPARSQKKMKPCWNCVLRRSGIGSKGKTAAQPTSPLATGRRHGFTSL